MAPTRNGATTVTLFRAGPSGLGGVAAPVAWWSLRPAPNVNTTIVQSWRSITYGAGMYVALAITGTTNRVMTSPDGVNWTQRTTPAQSDNQWESIAYSGSLFVAVASTGTHRVMVSADAITWTAVAAPAGPSTNAQRAWKSVAYGGGMFYAVSDTFPDVDPKGMYSTNGTTWTLDPGITSGAFSTVAYGAGKFVVTAESITRIYYKAVPDGTAWSTASWPHTVAGPILVIWTGTAFVGIRFTTTVAGSNATQSRIATSPDGITWTAATGTAISVYGWPYAAAGGGMVAALQPLGVQTGLYPEFIRSFSNGSSWVVGASYAEQVPYYGVTFGGGIFVSVDAQSSFLSRDGSAARWIPNVICGSYQWQAVTYGGGRWVAVSSLNAPDAAMWSDDAVTWNRASTPNSHLSDNQWQAVTYGGGGPGGVGQFVAVAQWTSVTVSGTTVRTGAIMRSLDGITWSNPVVFGPLTGAPTFRGIAWSPTLALYVAVSEVNTGVYTSPDGTTWTPRTAVTAGWQSVTWAPALGLFVAVANSGSNRVMTSPDGITWTARTAAQANSWTSVAWSPTLGRLVAVASAGTSRVMTSTDAITWTAVAVDSGVTGETSTWRSVTWGGNQFMAVADTGLSRAMRSIDGLLWSVIGTPNLAGWTGVGYGNGRFTAVATTVPEGLASNARVMTYEAA